MWLPALIPRSVLFGNTTEIVAEDATYDIAEVWSHPETHELVTV